MNNPLATIAAIERYILFSKEAVDNNPEAMNLPQFEKIEKQDYKNEVIKIDYSEYIDSADYHYFVSRVLFLNHVIEYSFFSAQQCAENYFKAYLKAHNETPPDSHDLTVLLKKCREITLNTELFINSSYVEVIVQKFNPFNEVARYPVWRTRPKERKYMFLYPLDIYVLDYFVYRMKEDLPDPKNAWDIFGEGHFRLQACQEHSPGFYDKFKEDNINFK